jgi:UDP-glucose 4-epimerase
LLVADGEDLSTAALLRRLACALAVRSRLFPVPAGMLRLAAAISGRRAVAGRLLDSLQLDIAPTCAALVWRPPVTVDAGLAAVADWYRA